MKTDKLEVWADLKNALDTSDREPSDVLHNGLMAQADAMTVQTEGDLKEFADVLMVDVMTLHAQSRSKSRMDVVLAHEAMENGMKSLLIDHGVSQHDYRGHNLALTLKQVQKHDPGAFRVIQLYFDNAVKLCEELTGRVYIRDIFEYFKESFNEDTYKTSKYGSIEDGNNTGGGIGLVTNEVIRALIVIVLDLPAREVYSRIEEEATKALLAVNVSDPAWDAEAWIEQGPVRPRLEVVENLGKTKALRAAVRKCHKETKDSTIRYWAMKIGDTHVGRRMRAHNKNPALWMGIDRKMSSKLA